MIVKLVLSKEGIKLKIIISSYCIHLTLALGPGGGTLLKSG